MEAEAFASRAGAMRKEPPAMNTFQGLDPIDATAAESRGMSSMRSPLESHPTSYGARVRSALAAILLTTALSPAHAQAPQPPPVETPALAAATAPAPPAALYALDRAASPRAASPLLTRHDAVLGLATLGVLAITGSADRSLRASLNGAGGSSARGLSNTVRPLGT